MQNITKFEKNPEVIVDQIRDFELSAGEDYFDQNESVVLSLEFMSWAFGKGVLSAEKYNLWLEAYVDGDYQAESMTYCLSNEYDGEVEYSLYDWTDEDETLPVSERDKKYEENLRYVGQFIAENPITFEAFCNSLLETDVRYTEDDERKRNYSF